MKTRPKTWMNLLGTISVGCYGLYAIGSYGLSMASRYQRGNANAAEFFGRVAESLSFLGTTAQRWIADETAPETFAVAYSTPQLLAILIFVLMLMVLVHYREELDAFAPRRLFLWAVAFAAVSLAASPSLVKDFWLSISWGRMMLAGQNPYYVDAAPVFLQGLPIDAIRQRMTYGPLWACLSAATVWAVGGRALAAALVFKLLLAGAWIASLFLIRRLLADQPIWRQCIGVLIFGWLPLSVTQTVAEGHNDVFLVLGVMLWLWALQKDRGTWGTLALGASVLVKYVSAPLFLLDFLYLIATRRRPFWRYVPQALPTAALMAGVFAIFARSREFFSATNLMRDWHFFMPRDAVMSIGRWVGLNFWPWANIVRVAFWALALMLIVRYLLKPVQERFWVATLGVLSAVLFSEVGHFWPWFVLWPLAIAALVPSGRLSRWVLGIALGGSLLIVPWVAYPNADPLYRFEIPGVILYACAFLWLFAAPRSWFSAKPQRTQDGLASSCAPAADTP